MSRSQLIDAARSLGLATNYFDQGRRKRLAVPTDILRMRIVERCYGGGFSYHFHSVTEADNAATRMVACRRGDYGHLLGFAQNCLRSARIDLNEYKRLTSLKRRRPQDESQLLASAQQWLDKASTAQDLHRSAHAPI